MPDLDKIDKVFDVFLCTDDVPNLLIVQKNSNGKFANFLIPMKKNVI